MRPRHTKTLCIVSSLILTFIAQFNNASATEQIFRESVSKETNPRRILHQPLFPVDTSPPPPSTPAPPLFPAPDQYQPPQGNGTEVSTPSATKKQQTKSRTKIFATGISVAIVILGMISGFAFYLYKHRRKHFDESQKQFRGNSRGVNEEGSISSTFLYIGTIEPSAERMAPEIDQNRGTNGFSLKKMSDRHRPSPELQPLPPLSKPFLPTNSPSVLSSSDVDSTQETTFYTPKGSIFSNEEGSNSPSRNNSTPMNLISQKSDLFSLSPESNQPHAATRPLFSSPPPPPDFARVHLITNQYHEMSRASVPPPPPPPPPPVLSTASTGSIPAKKQSVTAIPKAMNPQLSSPTLQEAPKNEEMGPIEDMDMINSSKRDNGDEVDESRPKLKALHWDKVRATSDRATVWDKFASSSFRLNEDAMESLFVCEPSNSTPKEKRKSVMPPAEPEKSVLDPKKSQNIAILLRALNVTRDEVSEELLDGNIEELGPELLETLMKMAPTKEEEIKLRDYSGDTSRLGSAERFLKAILDIPFAFKRVDAMLYRANFDAEINYLTMSFLTLEEASKELKHSKLFLKLLEAVLKTGNRMNDGTNRGDARAFKLDTLLKLADVKGTDGKTTLLHFVVQEIIRSEGADSESTSEDYKHISYSEDKAVDFRKQRLDVVTGLSRELGNVKKAASMDTDVLSSYVSKLELGLEKVRLVLQHEKPDMQGKFFESMKDFLQAAEERIAMIKSQEQKALSSVKEVTEYFHGDAAQEEAHSFRIFAIVRDFLVTLDNVCKEVGKIQDRSMVTGTCRSFRAPETASFPS